MDELKLVMGEDGVVREYKEAYCVIECPEQEDYDHIVKMVERGEKMRWIPVTEMMPENQEYVLVCATCHVSNKIEYLNAVTLAWVGEVGFIDVELDEVLSGVTYWMPLPEPPEEESP